MSHSGGGWSFVQGLVDLSASVGVVFGLRNESANPVVETLAIPIAVD